MNILVNSEGSVKLADFGIAKKLDNSSQLCDTGVGTPIYMAPERQMYFLIKLKASLLNYPLGRARKMVEMPNMARNPKSGTTVFACGKCTKEIIRTTRRDASSLKGLSKVESEDMLKKTFNMHR